MRETITVLLFAGIVGMLVVTKVYVLQEILAGLLSVAILVAVGGLVLVLFALLREGWQHCFQWAKQLSRV